jgi:ABC-2 type transport system ATP-binding protein
MTGRDAAALEQTVTQSARAAHLKAEPIATGLEDVFIYLMKQSAAEPALPL